MRAQFILFSLLSFNLIIGNLIIGVLLSGRSETISTGILLHTIFSIIAILLLLFLIWLFKQKNDRLTIFFSSIIAAFLVPTISIYVLSAVYGFYEFEFDLLIKGIPLAIILGIVSWPLWLPMGLINFLLFIAYIRRLKDYAVVS